ncbi:glycosyltransferase family 2 protein [uncultured Microbacterium sp.]|uniref:glycosyltransferase family 2 protein n=1 Tax=uncultured Microbacterium sp. TaxID=191216 RepID=UPI0028D76AC5|nr:glycosyltransferase family 2 protein [uncultured Microbacterium sp.]
MGTALRVAAQAAQGTLGAVDVLLVVVFSLVTASMTFSALMYLMARGGALRRLSRHERASRSQLDVHFADGRQSMTVLVPSYAEESRVIRATLWSAALQEFPSLRVVLLVDDDPFPTSPTVLAKLEKTRHLPDDIASALREPAREFAAALAAASAERVHPTPAISRIKAEEVVFLYARASQWLSVMADAEEVVDHADQFFVDQVLRGLARELTAVADDLKHRIAAEHVVLLPDLHERRALLGRLVRIFDAHLTVFDRKRYASLSHEANKAMNLNSYIGLMGASWVIDEQPSGEGTVRTLQRTRHALNADFDIPASDYLLTLDADSLLVAGYCERLVHVLEQPGNERMAVIQTPYSSYRGASSLIERIAGATTDLQHLQHQGKSAFDATFWVGANAIIRTTALDDIVELRTEDGPAGTREVRTYIQDRTVIEDTESSMDLAAKGWSLYNYPERLSFSATPPDFGSLVVQRRRWANGGLIILPKITELVRGRRSRGERMRLGELLLRVDYLGSIAWTTVGVILMLILPEAGRLMSPVLFLIALPYFAAMTLDLRAGGHRAIDVVWVFCLNLVLIPVNMAGVLKSMEQGLTRRKIPFARTPKIVDRVAAPALFVVLPYATVVALGLLAWRAAAEGHWAGFVFACVTGLASLVGAIAFVGTRTALADIGAGLTFRRKPRTPRPVRAARHGAPRVPAVTPQAVTERYSYVWTTRQGRSVRGRYESVLPTGAAHSVKAKVGA